MHTGDAMGFQEQRRTGAGGFVGSTAKENNILVAWNLVAAVGEDFSDDDLSIFSGRNIKLDGLKRVAGAKTFFWSGEYGFDLNVARTRDTQLNVIADFKPQLAEAQRNPDVLFLANIQPDLQLDVLRQCRRPRLVALDTMNL